MKSGQIEVESEFTMVYKYQTGKPCIVFLHGLAGSKEYFDPVFWQPLANEWGILTMDIPGFGESRVLDGDYSMEAQARRIGLLLEKLELGQVVLVAHSYAGPIAHLLYQRYADQISGMVLAETAFEPGERAWTVRITAHSREEYREVFAETCENGEEFYRPVLVDQSREKLQLVADALRQTTSEVMYESSLAMLEYCQRVDLIAEMTALPIPMVYILGETHEPNLKDDSVLVRLQEYRMPIKVLPGSGHCMMVDEPEGFYRMVGEFVE